MPPLSNMYPAFLVTHRTWAWLLEHSAFIGTVTVGGNKNGEHSDGGFRLNIPDLDEHHVFTILWKQEWPGLFHFKKSESLSNKAGFMASRSWQPQDVSMLLWSREAQNGITTDVGKTAAQLLESVANHGPQIACPQFLYEQML